MTQQCEAMVRRPDGERRCQNMSRRPLCGTHDPASKEKQKAGARRWWAGPRKAADPDLCVFCGEDKNKPSGVCSHVDRD